MATILIAEDEQRLADVLVRGFQLSGYQTQVAASGDVALEKLLEREFDLCLLDLMMPGLDGMTVLDRARKQGVTQPIVVLSALGDRDTKDTCSNLGANEFVSKPFSIRTLRERVNYWLAA